MIYQGGDQATIYQSGNLFDATNNGILDGVDKGWTVFGNYLEGLDFTKTDKEFPFREVATDPADVALQRVLEDAGATKPQRDAVDSRVVHNVRKGKGKTIRTVGEVGGWPKLSPGTPPADGDRDGMPDGWELAQGLDPSDPSDANGDLDGNGYTNIEDFINFAAPWTGGPVVAPRLRGD